MFGGKMKALTFSYDDGVTQDIRLIELFNKYGLKATFNLNSEFLGGQNNLVRNGVEITHNKVKAQDVRAIYTGHEAMEEADVLYGVTMQERGISRILTINLNDMAKELKIKS